MLHRRYSENGVVVLVNTALAAELAKWSDVPRRTLQRLLNEGTIPKSKIGNTYFVPLNGLEAYLKALRLSTPGVFEGGKDRGKIYLDGATSDQVKIVWWPV